MFVYESHLYGDIYSTDHKLRYDELYCEQCGDCDRFIGEFDSAITLLKHLANDIDVNDGNGGYAIESLLEALTDFEDVPVLKDAIEIVKSNHIEVEDC